MKPSVSRLILGLLALGLAGMPSGRAEESSPAINPEAQEALRLLDAKDSYTRQQGFMRLEALREPSTAAIVRQYLASRNADTRAFSVRALAAIAGAQAVPEILERLQKDRSPYVRRAALLALEPLQVPDVLPKLIERLRDRNPEVRMAAVDIVSRIDHPDARAAILTRWRRERNRDVRRVLQDAMHRLAKP